MEVDVVRLREVLIVVLVEPSSWLDAAVTTAAVNCATLAVAEVVAVVVSFVSVFAFAVELAPAFGTAVHLFPSMLVMKAPPARVDILSRLFDKALLLIWFSLFSAIPVA